MAATKIAHVGMPCVSVAVAHDVYRVTRGAPLLPPGAHEVPGGGVGCAQVPLGGGAVPRQEVRAIQVGFPSRAVLRLTDCTSKCNSIH